MAIWVKPFCPWLLFYECFDRILKIRITWVRLCCFWFSLLNALEIENSMSLWLNFVKTLYGGCGSNRIVRVVSWSEFARNIAKLNIDRTLCDFTKWKIWINPCCPSLKFSKNISSSKKELAMEICVESLKEQYGLILLSWSEFAICAFDKNWSRFSKWTM